MPHWSQSLGRYRRALIHRVLGPDHLKPDGACRLAPAWLILVVNNNCNLRCKMCDVGLGETSSVFYTHLVGDDPRNMSHALLARILSQAKAFSPHPKIGLAFTEPLIHRDILDFCRTIVQEGFFCSITTNGFMLPRLARDLVEIGVDEITVSADGPQDVHNRIRGRSNSFQKLYAGVEALNHWRNTLGRRRPIVRFSYTITDENYTDLSAFVEEIAPLQPRDIVVSHLNFISEEMATVHNAGAGAELPVCRSNLGTMDLETIDLNAMGEALRALKALMHSRPDLPPIQIVPDLNTLEELQTYYLDPLTFIGGRRCTDPWQMMMIRTDGSVIPAHGRCYDYPIDNVHEAPLYTLWNHERFRTFRKLLQAEGGTLQACARCCGVIGKPRPATS